MQATDISTRKGYVAVLFVAAVAILVAGMFLRPKSTPEPVRSESEFLRLQILTQRRDLQRRSLFFQTLALNLVSKSQAAREKPAQFSYVRPGPGAILLLVETDASGQPVWATATAAGTATANCDGREIEEIALTIAIPVTLADATAFDLEDNVAGIVVSCGDRRILTTPQGFELASQPTFAERLQACCGLQVAPGAGKKGFEIAKLIPESRHAKAGLRLGDRIVAVNGTPVESEPQLEPLLGAAAVAMSIERGRSSRAIAIKIPPVANPESVQ